MASLAADVERAAAAKKRLENELAEARGDAAKEAGAARDAAKPPPR